MMMIVIEMIFFFSSLENSEKKLDHENDRNIHV